jgi:protein gp37
VKAGVPYLFKQWGEWKPMDTEDVPRRGMSVDLVSDGSRPTVSSGCFHVAHQIEGQITDPDYNWQFPVLKVGKKKAGRLLDGRTWDETPA